MKAAVVEAEVAEAAVEEAVVEADSHLLERWCWSWSFRRHSQSN